MALGDLLGGFGSGAIGGAVVTLSLANDKYKTDLASSQAQTKTATGTMGSTIGKFKALAAPAFLALGVAAVKFGADSVAAAREAQASQTELANSIENSATVSESAIPAFNEQAEAIRKLTGADDEAITSAQGFLIQMKLTEDQVLALTPLIVDLATKMDVDMQTAAKAVGKAVNGNVGGLTRMGVVVDENAAAADAYTATLRALGGAEGFAAEKADDEPFRLLASQFEELQEQIGGALIPFLNDMAEILTPLVTVIGAVTDKVLEFRAASEKPDSSWWDQIKDFATSSLPDQIAQAWDATIFGSDEAAESVDAAGEAFRSTARKIVTTSRATHRFANMSEKDLKEWKDGVRDSFDAVLGELDAAKIEWTFTAQSFGRAMNNMRIRAQTLDENMRGLAKADWVPEGFKKWIIDQGPDALKGFMDQSRKQKEASVDDWRASAKAVDGAKGSLNNLRSSLTDLDNTTATGTVRIRYEYVGYDPQMPGQ